MGLPPRCTGCARRSAHHPTPRDMAAHSVAAAHATIAARAGSAPGGCTAAPSERLDFSLSSLAGRGLRSHLPPRRAPAASRRQCVRAAAVETLEGQTATGALLEKSVNTIRFLAIDAVEKANSGHPGLPMGCAPMGHILYNEVMRYNPKNPYWFNRDHFVLSAGHGCMLQYALLHLAGYDAVQEEDLKQFRQWGSRTPGLKLPLDPLVRVSRMQLDWSQGAWNGRHLQWHCSAQPRAHSILCYFLYFHRQHESCHEDLSFAMCG